MRNIDGHAIMHTFRSFARIQRFELEWIELEIFHARLDKANF